MGPDEKALRAHLDKPAFLMAVADKRWHVLDVAWPHVLIAVSASDDHEYVLRFDCTGYPATAPTAGPWDVDRKQALAHSLWPQSHGGRVKHVFRTDWKNGIALYLPCDREAIPGHNDWRQQMPSKLWRPEAGLIQYLELVHELLNCADYKSPAGTAA